MNKTPAETWRQYGPLFPSIPTTLDYPESTPLPLAQLSCGNPVAEPLAWRLT